MSLAMAFLKSSLVGKAPFHASVKQKIIIFCEVLFHINDIAEPRAELNSGGNLVDRCPWLPSHLIAYLFD
jgi:hypothetical protein